jgi:lipopolysaccharide biosynthesis protein
MEKRPKILAFYLPQYYPFKENDEWWGKGFTEWTSVGRAKPLFKGHYQPKVPKDLGYYDLRLRETRIEQAKLAEEYGVNGFVYWHYWFGNGKRLLDIVEDEVTQSGEPNFPYCYCWANHTWYSKNSNSLQ